MKYVGLSILIGSQFSACTVQAMETKTLRDVVLERVCNDEKIYRRLLQVSNPPDRRLLEQYYQKLLDDHLRIHAVNLWNLFGEQFQLGGHRRTITVCAFLDQDHAVTGCAEGRLCFWDVKTASLLFSVPTQEQMSSLVVLPQISPSEYHFITASSTCVRRWHLHEHELPCKWQFQVSGTVTSLAVTSTGAQVAIAVEVKKDEVKTNELYLIDAISGIKEKSYTTILPRLVYFSQDDEKLMLVGWNDLQEIDVATGSIKETKLADLPRGTISVAGGRLLSGVNQLQVPLHTLLCVCEDAMPSWNIVTYGGLDNLGHIRINGKEAFPVQLSGFVKSTVARGNSILFGGQDGALVLVKLNRMIEHLTAKQARVLFSYGMSPEGAKAVLHFMQEYLGRGELPQVTDLIRMPRGIIPFMKEEYAVELAELLYRAAERGNSELVRLLLMAGYADPYCEGLQPKVIALQNGHHQVAELLEKYPLIESMLADTIDPLTDAGSSLFSVASQRADCVLLQRAVGVTSLYGSSGHDSQMTCQGSSPLGEAEGLSLLRALSGKENKVVSSDGEVFSEISLLGGRTASKVERKHLNRCLFKEAHSETAYPLGLFPLLEPLSAGKRPLPSCETPRKK
jgi:hypothetical protein